MSGWDGHILGSVMERSGELTVRLHTRVLRTSSPYRIAAVFVVIVAVTLIVRALSSNFLAHDDGITMLGVTCNQGRYAGGIPTQQWIQASAWQDYWRLHIPGCFDQIRTDMANFDIHPSLYFWVLHLWFVVFGVSIPGALTLNVLLIAVAGLLIFATCSALSVPAGISVTVVLTWAVTMSARSAGAAIRPYALLTVFAAALLLLTVLWFRRGQGRYLAAMAPVVAGGMLTQFLFLVPATAVLLVIGASLVTGRRYRDLALLLGAYVVAAIAFVVVEPEFMNSVHRGGAQAQPFTWAGLPVRVAGVLAAVFETFVPLDPAYQIDAVSIAGWLITAVVMVPVLVVAVRFLWRHRHGRLASKVTADSAPLQLFVGCWLAMVALFLLCVSPEHSMRPVYLFFLTPFLFVGLAVAAQRSATVIGVLAMLFVYQLVGVIIGTAVFVSSQHQGASLVPGGNAAIVLDSDRRGIVPPALWPVAPTVPTYVASQDQLLQDFPDLSGTRDRDLYYVSKVMFGDTYGNTIAKRRAILKEFADRGYVADHLGVSASMGGADVYRLTRH